MPQRILVLDDDEALLEFVRDTLVADGFDVVTASTTKQAIAAANKRDVDLFLTDINVPDAPGFDFRDQLRRISKYRETPIVFLTAADERYEVEIAQKVGTDKLVLKPIGAAELKRVVRVALGAARSETGPIPVALDKVLTQVVQASETGVLTAVAGATLKRVVFQNGKVVFAASNDPREVIGQAFVRAGLVSERDLADAFAQRDAGAGKAPPIGKVLQALRKVTAEQAEKVFERKIREAVLDLFLWKGGVVEYIAGGVDEADRPFPLALDLAELRIEGLKRRVKWSEVRRLLPDPAVRFAIKGGTWPKGFPKNEGDRVLAKHVEAGRTMAEIMVELRGQDFAVGARLAELVKLGALIPAIAGGFSGKASDSVTIDLDAELARMEDDEVLDADVENASHPDFDTTAPGMHPGTRVLPAPAPQMRGDPAEPIAGVHVGRPNQDSIFEVPAPRPAGSGGSAPAAGGWAPISTSSTGSPTQWAPPGSAWGPMGSPVAPEPQQPEPRTGSVDVLTRSLVLMRAGDLTGARAGLMQVLEADPMNPLARQRLFEVEAALTEQARAQMGLTPDVRVRLAVPLDQLKGKAIGPQDAFVLTRIAAGALTVGELVRICPMPEGDVVGVVVRYLQEGVLART